METVSDGCPTGILIDIDLQAEVLSNITKENEKIKASIKKINEKIIAADTKSSQPWTSKSFLDQSPPRPPPILQMNFSTPKSSWKTPSPRSMKIISREASRIVDRLYSSPINCSEVMIHDEVFPAVKSLDDACLDEFHTKSKGLPTTDATYETVDQNNPNSLDLRKCTILAVCSSSSKDSISDEKLSKIVLQSDIKPAAEQSSISGNKVETKTPENASDKTSYVESYASNEHRDKYVSCVVNSNPVIPKCVNERSDIFLAHDHKVMLHKKMPTVAKGFGFKMSLEHSEKNKENILQSNGIRRVKYGPMFSKAETSYGSIEDEPKKTKIKKNQILRDESMVEKSSKKNIAAKGPVLEKKKENRNSLLDDSFSKKSKAFLQKSDVTSQSLLYKKDPLCKTAPLFGTPVVPPSVHRMHSFHVGSSRNAFPAERKFMPTTVSCSRVLKPKVSLDQVSNNGNGLSTPLQFGRFKSLDSSAVNPVRRKSLAFNSTYSLVAGDIKAAAQNNRHSIIKKPAVASSGRLGLVKKSDVPSSHLKFKNDSLPRKLFP